MTVAALIQNFRTRGVVLRPDGAYLEYEAPAGVLTEADLETLRARKTMVLSYLRWEQRGGAPVLLSSAWPKAGSWQHAYATTGRHPLVCPQCHARTLRPHFGGTIGCAPCGTTTRSSPPSGSST